MHRDDSGGTIQDSRCSSLVTGCSMLDSGYSIIAVTAVDAVSASRSSGLLVRRCGAGFQPAHQSRSGLNRVSERLWDAPVCGGVFRVTWRPSAPAFRSACGGPAPHHRRGRERVTGEDCDHADGTPTACSVAGRDAPELSTARVARYDIVRSAASRREVGAGTMSNPARPGGGHTPADSGAAPARPGECHIPAFSWAAPLRARRWTLATVLCSRHCHCH